MTITDEMVEKALAEASRAEMIWAHCTAPVMRAALEAVAPMLIAQGMREAADICDNLERVGSDAQAAILARAQELDPK